MINPRHGPDPTILTKYANNMPQPDGPILFFDGVCNLCNGFIDWVVRRDKTGRLKIASLQGETALELIPEHAATVDTFVYYDQGQQKTRSDAVIATWRLLPGIWPKFAAVANALPQGFRDGIYRFVAKNRYRWFGKKDSCRLPTPAERIHFLP